ncbi:BF3164 family lipoprotein [uncultured Duncaniella sp.]|uniref:BF3164 family lipoprotein n=1 Tax=uncultured Duncaniella sp. TaxID=2768039 RepID=UPI0025B0C9E9|nr:BF3164 family lipoprotein [uncultured Duncaniella sp.]
MKTLISLTLLLMLVGCSANAQPTSSVQTLEFTGDSLPALRHITDMKISGDTLYFVYETEDGFGQRFLRSAVIDYENAKLSIRPEIGKREDGYYVSYMPYPFFDASGKLCVVGQDDSEIYNSPNGKYLIRTKKYLVGGNSTIPFPLSQYVQDISITSPDNYVFIGREPNGGSQYAMQANTATAIVDTIHKVAISPELQTWMPNAGELAYSDKHNRLAFAYRLHPVIDIFGMDGELVKRVRIAADTFDPKILEEADFEDLTPLHFVDISASSDYIYALYWGCMYSEKETTAPCIYKIDWAGNVIAKRVLTTFPIYKIAVIDEDRIIVWNGKYFINVEL